MLKGVLGDREGVVDQVRPVDIHGVTYFDVSLKTDDGGVLSARLGPEAVPDGLSPGDRVVATMAANMMVSLRRA